MYDKALGPDHPSEKQVGKAISPPPCEHGIPVYPLRYGVADAPCHTSTGLSSPYPALSAGKQQGLRMLRPGCYLYVRYVKNGRMWTRQYRVTENGRFTSLWWTEKDYRGEFPGRHARIDGGTDRPYVLIPKEQASGSVWLMVSDSMLSHRALCEIERDSARRDLLMRKIKPLGGKQAHCFAADHLPQALPELSGQVYPWSASLPKKAAGQTVADAMRVAALPQKDVDLLAVALPDPVGMLMDLNQLVGAALQDQEPYVTEAARKLRVWGMIESLADAARQRAIQEAVASVTIGGVRTHADYPYQRGKAGYASRMRFADHRAYDAFIKQHPKRLTSLQKAVDVAAADLWEAFQSVKPAYTTLLTLYENKDIENFIDRRQVGACTLTGLVHHPKGEAYLQKCVTTDGLTGWLHDLTLGNPLVGDWVDWRNSGAVAGGLINDTAIDRAQTLLKSIPADAASQQLSAMIGALIARSKLHSPAQFWTSAYRPAFEALDGQLAGAVPVKLKDAGTWVRDQLGIGGGEGFRPRTVAQKANEMLVLYETQDVQQTLNDMAKAPVNLRRAHNTRVGIGGLAVMVSTYNAAVAFNALGKEDGLILASALDAGGKVLGLGSSSLFMAQVYRNRLANLAREAGQGAKSEVLIASANKLEFWAIGSAAVAALVMAIRDFRNVRNGSEKGEVAAWSAVSSATAGAAASLGGLYVLGKVRPKWLVNLAKSGVTVAQVPLAVARTGSGILGWALLALDGLYSGARALHDHVAAEQAVAEWIARSVWGNQHNSSYFNRAPLEPFKNDVEELHAFYTLFLKPTITTNVQVLNTVGTLTAPGLAELRRITITLPGWRPQISKYKLTQVHGALGRVATYEDPRLVVDRAGVGVITLSNDTLIGQTKVEYWPNHFTELKYSLPESNYL
ncbi:toxin VasX [Burkholderia sp. BCC1999]|uniref:toxin VasX n=1 Tax=Burkholderia sp. BCC1999 TaxID=2817448 RepID=UPI002AC37154|nr:toxin VasX [Burkholderia sp. BCC1999]